MNETAIIEEVRRLEGVNVVVAPADSDAPEMAWGDTFFIYDPERTLAGAQQFPFATIVIKDYGEFDCASNLNRAGVFRLNMGLSTDAYELLFGPPSPDHLAGGGRDFSALDVLLPHPVYARQHWVSILNPSAVTFRRVVSSLLEGAHQKAAQKYRRSRSH